MPRIKKKHSRIANHRLDSKPHSPKTPSAVEVVIESEPQLDTLIEFQRRHDRIQLNGLLEQVGDPAGLLRRVRTALAPGGEITATAANAQHYRILSGLLRGSWLAAADPVLPAACLRFFTRRELEKLFYRTGFSLRQIEPLSMPADKTLPGGSCSTVVRLGDLEFDLAKTAHAQDILPEAYRIVASCEEPPDFGLTSIVILTHNQWEYTRRCLESIRFRTDEPYELIVVDNGSTDGTPLRLSAMADVRLIANSENRGFPAGVNQGIQAAQGRQILLLNNDVIVTTGWLRRQLEALYREPSIGLVGPCSNEVSGPQWIAAEYDDLSALDGFAWEWGKQHAGQLEAADRLVGFCLLIRKSLVDQIGLFDERFGIGNFEDDDFCRRAIMAGYRAVIARDAFVHHFGHRSFAAAGFDLRALLTENERRYREKWAGNTNASADDAASAQAPLAVGDRCGLSLCMIVRDNAGTIRQCLESIKPWVDEMVVVDTGSQDETPEIAKSLGASVFYFPWCDSFAAARNESLRHARGEWLFWMDSDDTISAQNGRKLRQIAAGPHRHDCLGYIMRVHCPSPRGDGYADVTVVDHVKLFRNRRGVQFEHRIHEQVLPSIRRAGGEVMLTDVFVEHSGADHTAEGRRRKLQRDLKLLELELAERPDHPFALFNLGMTYADDGRHAEAVSALQRALKVAHPAESHVRKIYALLASSLWQLKEFESAQRTCEEGRRIFPKDPELAFRAGMLAQHFGCYQDAVAAYEAALANDDEAHFSSIDRGVVGYKARQNLAIAYTSLGQLERAISQWRLIVEELPDHRNGWEGLLDLLIKRGDQAEAAAHAEKLSAHPQLRPVGLLALARIAQASGEVETARLRLLAARNEFPSDAEVQRAWCELLFHHASIEEAEAALEDLVKLAPDDASARHNLGVARARLGRTHEADACFEQSRNLRGLSATAEPSGRAAGSDCDASIAPPHPSLPNVEP